MMQQNKIGKKTIIALIVIWSGALIAFVMLKTTIGAGIVACLTEDVVFSDYIEIAMIPDGYDFQSYKNILVREIRMDKAAERRMKEEKQRRELAYESLKSQIEQVKGAYTYIQETATEAENLEKYNAYVNGLEFNVQTEEEKKSIKDFLGHIANTRHLSWSTDTYYRGYSKETVIYTSEDWQTRLTNSTMKEAFVIEQIAPGEYDPKPKIGLAKQYSKDLDVVKKIVGEDKFDYDYIVQFTSTYEDGDNIQLLESMITAVVSAKNYIIMEVETSLEKDMYGYIASYGSVRPFTNNGNVVMEMSEEPEIIRFQEMQAKADEFAGFFQEMVTTYFGNEDALEELYHVNFSEVTTENIQSETVAQTSPEIEGIDDGQVEYKNSQFAQIEKDLQAKIQTAYSKDLEWGTILVLQSLSKSFKDGVSILLTERYLNETNGQAIEQMVAQENQVKIYEQAGIIRNIYTNMKTPVLVSGNTLPEGNDSQSDVEVAIAEKDLFNVSIDFMEGCQKWYYESQPEAFVGGYFKYDVEGVCTLELNVLGTSEECYITDVGINWVDDNGMFADFSTATYILPNTILMEEQAKAEIIREDYQTEEEYNYAIAMWLYQVYPEYYEKPAQLYENSTSDSYYDEDNLEEYDMSEEMYNVDGGGSVGDFTDGITDFAEDVGEAISDTVNNVKEGVSDWWNNLWN